MSKKMMSARHKLLTEALSSAKSFSLRSWAQLKEDCLRWQHQAKSSHSQLGILSLAVGNEIYKIFEADCGIVVIRSDGFVFYAPRPL